jgi:DNA (cytosine-5)-methyltransferase 1
MLRQFDMCSGVGTGFPLAGLSLGKFDLVGVSEIDEYCGAILALRFPGVRNYDDARSLPCRDIRREHGAIDLLTASPPCQPFSLQGKRRGGDDPRDCFPAVKRAIESFRPRYFCIENVPGILSCPRGENHRSLYIQHFLRQITRLGYDTEWITISSGQFASPFLRERFLLVGVARGFIDPERATPWAEQVRSSVEERGSNQTRRGIKSPIFGESLLDSLGLDEPIGIKSGDGVVRNRREALGNALDPRVATVALERVLYLDRLIGR